MYIIKIIGGNMEVASKSFLEAYALIQRMNPEHKRISARYSKTI